MGDDHARRLILARRARFVAAALASVTSATTLAALEACGGSTEPTTETGTGQDGGGKDAGPQPCLAPTATAQPCLQPPLRDAGLDASDAEPDADGGIPLPCLAPLGDGG